ncbi:sigma-54 interaction domain-containing protein [Pelosinus fermentans]|uniref:Sigma54 specific transcriptional regulator, Fis family n=1 Tax=Pelosinus fermentans JBW45 TaxID=1192197 RepID=I8TZE3_9FIRM|nr:sigma 54-interacting transcriptional regulator [Pelosinus fermentans]AJQ29122.1 sigma54 specific transcriptional regulator, Fis family [Pelosinus fermentans JBW45]
MATHSEIMKQVCTHLYGLVVVDHKARIVFVEENYAKLKGWKMEDIIGRYIKDVVATSRLPAVLETGKPILGEIFYSEGKPLICNRVPLVKDGVIIGAMSFSVFEGVDKLIYSVEELRGELDYYKEKLKNNSGVKYSLENIIGSSDAVVALRAIIVRAACANSTVLIQGETGTGKELVAHALHQESRRSHHPFVKLNCAAIPNELIESELFGYDEGAFTGARRAGKKGKFEIAEKGTLFLDEVSQLSLAAQAKLLRALQEKEIERVGGTAPISVNIRIVAATNDDLEDLVKQGTFRSDLYYRLNVIPIKIAPLRERKTDIPLLIENFIERYGEQAGLGKVAIAPEAVKILMAYEWPGNIRELEHAIERAMNHCNSSFLEPIHFQWLLPKIQKQGKFTAGRGIQEAKAAIEKEVILNALQSTQGNKKKAAELLGIARPLLYQKIRRLGIQ